MQFPELEKCKEGAIGEFRKPYRNQLDKMPAPAAKIAGLQRGFLHPTIFVFRDAACVLPCLETEKVRELLYKGLKCGFRRETARFSTFLKSGISGLYSHGIRFTPRVRPRRRRLSPPFVANAGTSPEAMGAFTLLEFPSASGHDFFPHLSSIRIPKGKEKKKGPGRIGRALRNSNGGPSQN